MGGTKLDDMPKIFRAPAAAKAEGAFDTDVPARLDRLPWARFHWLVVVALGITWILDGLEVTLVGSLAGALSQPAALALSDSEIGVAASCYIGGAVAGALVFGYLTDRLGRRKLFMVTVLLYAVATIATGCAWNFWSFALFRLITGAGIGGEYVAINSAIQELIPARYRGWTDLAINGSFWIGAALGASGSLAALDPHLVAPALGWRLAFGIGGVLAFAVMTLRRHVPESPRWLMTHNRGAEASRTVAEIEARVAHSKRRPPQPASPAPKIRVYPRERITLVEVARAMLTTYPQRTVLCLVLMATQAFFYNAIFFTYALVLTRFYGIAPGHVGLYIFAFAAGNFLGPLTLGQFFDRIGRKTMIASTYAISGLLMIGTALLFERGILGAATQTAAWTVIFFFASAAASSAYLTIGESFPLEVRALVIALFYATGTALGGVAGPLAMGDLIATGSRANVMLGYLFGAALMLIGALAEALIGVRAERRPLEEVAKPLSTAD